MAVVLLALASSAAYSQVKDATWNGPVRLSTMDGTVQDTSITVDRYGYSHVIWIENRLFEERVVIRYARFDAEQWSTPIVVDELYPAFAGQAVQLSSTIDENDTLWLVWGGNGSPIHLRSVNIRYSLDLRNWKSSRYEIEAFKKRLLARNGVLHLIYSKYYGVRPNGVFYRRSTDLGLSWSAEEVLDRNVPAEYAVADLDATMDAAGRLHTVWSYTNFTGQVQRMLYSRSTDAGITWATPFILDQAPLTSPDFLRSGIPHVSATPSRIVAIWGGGGEANVGRRSRFSVDGGASWSGVDQLFGALHGVGGTDGTAVDSAGRLHVLAQVRWPQGLYHTILQEGTWSVPKMTYLIAEDAAAVMGERIHAQYLHLVSSPNQQLVTTMETCAAGCADTSTWPRNSILFGMSTKADLSSLKAISSVSSATYNQGLAPSMIAAGLVADVPVSELLTSPTGAVLALGGVGVEITDAKGVNFSAPIYAVAGTQVNFQVPAGVAAGTAKIRVRGPQGLLAQGSATIGAVAPGLYTINGQGTGLAAALTLRVNPDGSRTDGTVFDPVTVAPLPLDVRAESGELYLLLFGTGLRNFAGDVSASIGGTNISVLAVVPQPEFPGLDQVNLGPIPASLAGRGNVTVVLRVDGLETNPVTVTIQ
jgi:uncharacterized protein (TIGR03437 family)